MLRFFKPPQIQREVDDHNNKRQYGECGHGVSLDNTWSTTRWERRLSLIEVNAFLVMHFPSKIDVTLTDLRNRLAFEIIFNDVDDTDGYRVSKGGVKTWPKTQHYLVSAPPFCKYKNGKWEKSVMTKYHQHRFSKEDCKNHCHTSCRFDQTTWICRDCFSNNCLDVTFDIT